MMQNTDESELVTPYSKEHNRSKAKDASTSQHNAPRDIDDDGGGDGDGGGNGG
jgi:hypothetical protein